jgi:hypothetical protein
MYEYDTKIYCSIKLVKMGEWKSGVSEFLWFFGVFLGFWGNWLVVAPSSDWPSVVAPCWILGLQFMIFQQVSRGPVTESNFKKY